MDFSSGESDVDSEEEVAKAKKAEKEARKENSKGQYYLNLLHCAFTALHSTIIMFKGPIQSSLIDSTDGDLVVPAIEDLDTMTLEEITELREKIRHKVEKTQEEEKISQAKQQEHDDDYEYVWAEADPEEEDLKKV